VLLSPPLSAGGGVLLSPPPLLSAGGAGAGAGAGAAGQAPSKEFPVASMQTPAVAQRVCANFRVSVEIH
jgi:hypothetical protein